MNNAKKKQINRNEIITNESKIHISTYDQNYYRFTNSTFVLFSFLFFFSWTSHSLWVVSGAVWASGVSIPISVTAYYVCSFVTGLSHSGWYSLDAAIFLRIWLSHCFWWLSSIPLCICTTNFVSIRLLKDIWVPSSFWLL